MVTCGKGVVRLVYYPYLVYGPYTSLVGLLCVAAEVGLDITALSECKLCGALPEMQTGHKTYKATAKESSQAPSVCRLCQTRMQRQIARKRARRTAGVLRHASLRPEWPPTCLQGGALLCSGRCNSSSERPELNTQTRERGLNSVALMWG